jgi:hypothetical protein
MGLKVYDRMLSWHNGVIILEFTETEENHDENQCGYPVSGAKL